MLIKPFAIYPAQSPQKSFVSWEIFARRFGPIPREDGTYLWQLHELDTDGEENHWWTVYKAENRILLTPEVCLCDETYGYLKCWVQWAGYPCDHPSYVYSATPTPGDDHFPRGRFVRAPWDAVRTANARH